jgi:predicted GNAT family acetyltransferase
LKLTALKSNQNYFRKKEMKAIKLFCCLAALLLAGCSSSKISTLPVSGSQSFHSVKVIAFTPGGGLVADAVGVELSNRGFTVIDSSTVSSMMVRLNMNEIEIARPEGLSKLRGQGIDAMLTVRAASGYDDQPQSISARMNSTETGQVLAGVTWQNGYGCAPGSPCDRQWRKGLTEASAEIAEALSKRVKN